MVVLSKIFNSSAFGAFATIVVGCLAIYLYTKGKRDAKREAARLIVQEIRYAENKIRQSKTNAGGELALAEKLLPTNSWQKNINYFSKDLNETQLDLVSSFYSHVEHIDSLVGKIADFKLGEGRCSRYGIIEEGQMMEVKNDMSVLSKKLESFDACVSSDPGFIFAKNRLNLLVGTLEFIYNSPIVERLTKISNGWW